MSGLILDIPGTELRSEDIDMLQHPAVVGVILFTRNFVSPAQLCTLTEAIRKAAQRDILITVDHEGGRVQRFREGFTAIPAMAQIRQAGSSRAQATMLARELGWLMAKELLVCGVDHSFAPVLDVDGPSTVIGDRAFSDDPEEIVALAHGFIRGMHEAGMKATGKHFPGHGTVVADSHIDVPVDDRSLDEILAHDGRVFAELAPYIQAVMPAHVIYPQVAPEPAGFSPYWLQEILRGQYGFEGLIISDDLLMAGAHVAGNVTKRAEAAIHAGCDLLLVCNDSREARVVLETVSFSPPQRDAIKLLGGTTDTSGLEQLQSTKRWQEARVLVDQIKRR
ncbi:beta-N-acetylhexosaminidase [Aliidiomarina sanyensis]|uniref:Beta-hexosaminidase n=1 Tax=Aliidiomarina sanyensis TaxID=1249555 RepID=A0A432WEW1_9GAMM|nr:beta-N-acetylhexosaminidase [Aliidiomarina sanyensis]RUO31348.1 beta-N-acetylhexosaminidase [Aliidiomarina sanyensis]